MKGNWVCTFGLGTVLKNTAVLFENCDEEAVRLKMSKQCREIWADIYPEDVYRNKTWAKDYTLIKGNL